MSSARVEEVDSDSDPEEVVPSLVPSDMAKQSILSPENIPQLASASSIPRGPFPEMRREIPRHFQCLYPVYFDKSRTRAEGRKVGSELAVENPLARDIVDAVQLLGLGVGLEPEKLHPKDWANPGRVRVMLKDENGRSVNSRIKNSTFILILLRGLFFFFFFFCVCVCVCVCVFAVVVVAFFLDSNLMA